MEDQHSTFEYLTVHGWNVWAHLQEHGPYCEADNHLPSLKSQSFNTLKTNFGPN